MNGPSDKQATLSPCSASGIGSLKMLDSMSAVELADALEHTLETVTESTYDETLIGAYLDALDKKIPIPNMPDVETAFADFQTRRERVAVIDTQQQAVQVVHKQPVRFRRAFRVGLAAAFAAVCILGTMAVAQAAGVDVFGAVARWTSDVFSFGQLGSGATDYSIDGDTTAIEENVDATQNISELVSPEYASLQEALDANNVTEVHAPTWIPDSFILESITATHSHDPEQLDFYAEYLNGSDVLQISIANYFDIPTVQIEKTDTPVKKIELDGITLYQMQNINNNIIAWVTEHFEYYISGTLDPDTLVQIALSACVS